MKKSFTKIFIFILFLFFIFSSIFFSFKILRASGQRRVVYLTSWDIKNISLDKLKGMTHLNLAFANIEKDYSLSWSDDFLKYNEDNLPNLSQEIEADYLRWTQYKYQNPNTKVLLSFGGEAFQEMWTLLNSEEGAKTIAHLMNQTINKSYPVYFKEKGEYIFKGMVTLDGVDLDYEPRGQIGNLEVNSLILLMAELKRLSPHKIVSLTGFHTSADPLSCQLGGRAEDGCSYPAGSSKAGGFLPIFAGLDQKSLDFYNIMAYDADPNYDYKTSLENHAKYLAKDKINLGLSLGLQWGSSGYFLENLEDLETKAKKIKSLGFGGIMIWAIGANDGLNLDDKNYQIEAINKIIQANQ